MSDISSTEEEITVMAKVGDFNGFQKADNVVNIQELSTYIEGRGKFRQRKISGRDGTNFVSNVKPKGVGNVIKTTKDEDIPSTAAYYETCRLMADQLTIRDRYTFNGSAATIEHEGKTVTLPPINFDVDVFHRFDGRESEWIKIDIEVNRLVDALESLGLPKEGLNLTISISHLPFLPVDAFIVQDDNTPEQLAIIKKLWEDNAQDPNGGPMKKEEDPSTQGQ